MSDCVDVKELICPYCGHEHDVPHEILNYRLEQETQIMKCRKCNKKFKAMVDLDPRFTTEVMEEDEYLIF